MFSLTIQQLQAERGPNSIYHNNSIATRMINKDGSVYNVRLGQDYERRSGRSCHLRPPIFAASVAQAEQRPFGLGLFNRYRRRGVRLGY